MWSLRTSEAAVVRRLTNFLDWSASDSMIVVLNGPLGIGKSTLAEALAERMEGCVMLDGDSLIAANPAFEDPLEHLHSTIALLVTHHRRFGYRHFVITHIWRSPPELSDLRRRLESEDFRCFQLTLSLEENLQRIVRRASTRAINELDYERQIVVEEREALMTWGDGELGEILEVNAAPDELVETLVHRLRIR